MKITYINKNINKEEIYRYFDIYDDLSIREKNIITISLCILIVLLSFVVIIEPVIDAKDEYLVEIVSSKKESRFISNKIESIESHGFLDPNIAIIDEINNIRSVSENIENNIDIFTDTMVDPSDMISLLDRVLKKDKGIKLIALMNGLSQPVYLNGDENSKIIMFRHYFDIEMESTYSGALNYVSRLEGLPWKLFIQEVNYESTQYPSGILKIKIYTLSQSQEIIGV